MKAEQLNVEYWFRLLYECIHGTCYGGSVETAQFSAFLANLWLWIIIIGYVLSVIALFMIVYLTVRIFELRERERKFYSTLIPVPGSENDVSPRWKKIEALASSSSTSEWREAIIEADIMLDDLLARRGYIGDGVGEKLKNVEFADLRSLQDAWEAHKVRNQIAHEGSAFALSETLTHRTIAHYQKVFTELKAI